MAQYKMSLILTNNLVNRLDQINGKGREPQLRVSQSRGSRGDDVQATRSKQPGEGRLGLLQNHVVIGFSGMNSRQ